MQQLDRKTPPQSIPINHIDLKEISSFTLSNGTTIYYLNTPNTGVLKIDFVFNAGLRNQQLPGQASATSALLSEGTSSLTAQQLAEALDKYGAYLQSKTSADDAQITLYCLPKFLNQCIPFVQDVLTDCVFPEKELETYKTNAIQRLKINRQRNSFLGRRAFYASIFGNTNAYGSSVNQGDYESISRETLSSFYTQNYLSGFKYILVSGDVSGAIIKELEAAFGVSKRDTTPANNIHISGNIGEDLFIENDHSVQSSMRIGRSFINRNHPDFNKMQLLNLALGGYFGSRLMKNIREEKGLTYGIHSGIESFWSSGAFYIETEINNDLRETGKLEILKEIARLRNEPISEQELSLVKNYMLGSFLRGVDGPFSLMDRYKMLLDYGFTYQYYQNFVDTIKATSSLDLQILANTYWQETMLTTVIVGKK